MRVTQASGSEILSTILSELGYAQSEGLVTPLTPPDSEERDYVWSDLKKRFQFDAVYFHGNIPIVCFQRFEHTADIAAIDAIHRHAWNHNRAPLLVAVLPDQIRIYNCFLPPAEPTEEKSPNPLIDTIDLASTAVGLIDRLSPYTRPAIDAGKAILDQLPQQRVDSKLLRNLSDLRSELVSTGLSSHLSNGLITRAIFVRYLEDRGVLHPDLLLRLSFSPSTIEVFRNRIEFVRLYEYLANRFHGDIFPLSETDVVEIHQRHLDLVAAFLLGTDIATGQRTFWPYDFNFIPIDLISSIYERFLNDERGNTAAFYTPPGIASFVLDEIMPWDLVPLRILDPSCGSGVFLVEAYRRLVYRESRSNSEPKLSFKILERILKNSIFGIDTDRTAINIAVFSCYLALLDYLEPIEIWENVTLPALVGRNFHCNDFFSPDLDDLEGTFDLVIGNPPWGTQPSSFAKAHIQDRSLAISDNQLALAFLWRAGAFVRPSGKLGLLVPAKPLLFNTSQPNRSFREKFFQSFHVSTIANFSAYRHRLFHGATSPLAIIFFRNFYQDEVRSDYLLTYVAPTSAPPFGSTDHVNIYSDEVHRWPISRFLQDQSTAKILMWGKPRDFSLIEKLRSGWPSLEEVISNRGWIAGEGVQKKGGDQQLATEYIGIPWLSGSQVEPFRISRSLLPKNQDSIFHRRRSAALFSGPLVVVREGILDRQYIVAAFSPDTLLYTDAVLGIAGTSESSPELMAMTLILNSSLAQYFHFLTSSRWGIEREALLARDIKETPYPFFSSDDPMIEHLAHLYSQSPSPRTDIKSFRAQVNEAVFDAFELSRGEHIQVEDLVRYQISAHARGRLSPGFDAANMEDLDRYTAACRSILLRSLGLGEVELSTTPWSIDPHTSAVSFSFEGLGGLHNLEGSESREAILASVDKWQASSAGRIAGSHSIQRVIVYFDSTAVHVIKPSEKRFWSESTAFNDADGIVGTLIEFGG